MDAKLVEASKALESAAGRNPESEAVVGARSILIDSIFAPATYIAATLGECSELGMASFGEIRDAFKQLQGGLEEIEVFLPELPEAIQSPVKEIGTIVNDASCNIGFADVCQALLESKIKQTAETGWKAYIRLTKRPAVSWADAQSEEAICDADNTDERARIAKGEAALDGDADESHKEKPYIVDEKLCQIRIDGKSHNVTDEAARMAKLLLDNGTEWVSMSKHEFSKPSTTKGELPDAVQELIDSGSGKGYRLRPRRNSGA